MSSWNADERRQAEPIIRQIDAYCGPRRTVPQETSMEFRLSEGLPLLPGTASTYRAIAIRQLYRCFQFDEHRVFHWRLEHKLVQALVLNQYCPGDVPTSQGLGRKVHVLGAHRCREVLQWEFPQGIYVKPALGDSSGEHPGCDQTGPLLERVLAGSNPQTPKPTLSEEEVIVQERLPIVKEYRVHSLEDQVVEDLTFLRYGRGNIPGERDAPNAFVQSVLDRLPAGIVAGSLYGWDIALVHGAKFRIIEMNPTGVHPVYRPGFQCSGYFQDPDWGASLVARLLRFVERRRQVKILIRADAQGDCSAARFYADVAHWQGKFETVD